VKSKKKPYLKHEDYNQRGVNNLQFIPYEDFLGIGLVNGFSSIVVPGAGEANFDTFEVNVFETKKQRREAEVVKLLDKLPADTISVNPTVVGTIDKASKEVIESEKKAEKDEAERIRLKNKRKREKARGKSSTGAEKKKKESVYDDKTRKRISDLVDSKIQLKKLEKQKLKAESNLMHDDLLDDFNPLTVLKKLKTK